MSSNQSLWADFGVVEELTEQAAETISGGATEVFSIFNNTNANVPIVIDGNLFGLQSGQVGTFTAIGGGIITFDDDFRAGITSKSYDLSDGGSYVFEPNQSTADIYDINLYRFA